MLKILYIRSNIKNWALYSLLVVIIIGPVFPTIMAPSAFEFLLSREETYNTNSFPTLEIDEVEEPSFPLILKTQAEDPPEAYFPNFLIYSVEIANALIENLYDNESGGFFVATDEHWQSAAIIPDKRAYDNAQAILALLKLADAVINETERDFALNIAEKTGNFLITDLHDDVFDGFFTSDTDRLKKPGMQAKAIEALLALYEVTGNDTYRDMAVRTYDFLESGDAWNNSGFYAYYLSHSGFVLGMNPNLEDPYEPFARRVDHNALMGKALLDLYRVSTDDKYLTKAIQIYDFFNTSCRNKSTNLFYTGLNSTDGPVDPYLFDIFANSLVLEFLAELYNVTEDSKYYQDFFSLLLDTFTHFWDERYGGFYATFSSIDPGLMDKKKYTERLLYAIRAFDEAFKMTDNDVYYNLILDIVEVLNNKLYDNIHFGYYQLANNDGTITGGSSWTNKFAVTQSLAIFTLANLWLYSKPGVLNALWVPSTPRPQDSVTISVAAFDSEGIFSVSFNYSVNNDPYEVEEMDPHPSIGDMYTFTLDPHSDGTTINFNIIVNNSKGHQTVRSSYFFLWQIDDWAPRILEIGFDMGIDIPVDTSFSVTVSAQDVPSQGNVKYVRMYYHKNGKDEQSIPLEQSLEHSHLWSVTYPEGLSEPGTYGYYFEAIDYRLNFGYSSLDYFYILGTPVEPIPISFLIGVFFIAFIVVPAGLYTYIEYKKKAARKILKGRREIRYRNRHRKRGKRGSKRIKTTPEIEK
jgi:mannose/cellobiose epimerase-like protein (N-acyl-D-glucosamine 2-epimerase family)